MQTYTITSRQNPTVKTWLDLRKDKQAEIFIVEGAHLVEMAAHNHHLLAYIGIAETTLYPDVDHYVIHPSIAEKLSEMKTTPGIFGLCKKIKSQLDFSKPILFLDDLRDPGNMGTMMRSALAFGFINVVASQNSVNFYHEKVITSGQGAHFALHLILQDFNDLYQQAKSEGYTLVVTTLEAAKPLTTLDKTDKIMLVIGNEARGVSPAILARADQRLRIDMNHQIESLNAGVAASIIMHHHYSLKTHEEQ